MEEGRRQGRRVAAALLALCGACGGSARIAPPEPGSGEGSAAAAAAAANAALDRELVDCAATTGPDVPAAALPQGWTASGRAISKIGGGPDATATVGVIADAGGDAPTTLAALGRLRAQLDAAHVDVVVSLGGMGGSAGELEAALAALATGAAWPLVALPGDSEPAPAHDAAVAALRQRGVDVVDGRLARWVLLPGAAIATLPGAGAVARSGAGADGCGYRAADVTALATALADKAGVRVLAASEAPRGTAGDGEPTGDLALPAGAAIDVVVHAATDTATAATTGGRDGAAASLSPGPADATARLPGPHQPPTAGVLSVHDGRWSWRVLTDKP